MEYHSKYTGAEVDALLDKIAEDNVGDIDSALSTTSENPVMNKVITEELGKKATKEEVSSLSTVVGEELNTLNESILENGEKISSLDANKADTSGYYPSMRVGLSDDLNGRGESVPALFGFRASGGKSIKDGRAYIKRIKGNSVVWNNMVDTRGYEGQLFIPTGIRIVKGHKYLLYRTETNQTLYLIPTVNGAENYEMSIHEGEHSGIFQAQYSDDNGQGTVYSEAYCGACIISDLTKMFQAGYEPSTIEEYEARKPIVADEYAYNEGQVIHCNTESIKSVGDNAWDEEWESGHIDYHTGVNTPDSGRLRTKDYIRFLPNEEYHLSLPTASYPSDLVVICYDENKAFVQHIGGGSANKTFRIPTNCHYIRFTWDGTQYANNIMLTLVHSGWKQDTDAGYQPYWQDTLPLPIIRKYFPQGMKSAGSAHDEIRFNKSSGKWEYSKGRIKSVELSSIIKEETNKDGEFLLTLPTNYAAITSVADIPRLLCSPFITNTVANVNGNNLNDCIYGMDDWLIIRSSRYFTLSDIKAEMADVMLYYESNDWEWVELDEADQNFRDYYQVADFGTEQSQSSVPSAAFSADIIYQFNAVDMIREHELEITELQKVIATMQAQLASLTSNNA